VDIRLLLITLWKVWLSALKTLLLELPPLDDEEGTYIEVLEFIRSHDYGNLFTMADTFECLLVNKREGG
jgi:hypothetical protein